MKNKKFTIILILLSLLSFYNCASFNRKNTPLIRAVENNLVPDTYPSKILLAPIYIPVGILGGILDIFIIHPALQIKPSFIDTKNDLWSIRFHGYFTEMGSLPVRAVISPVYFSLVFLFRSAFDFNSDSTYSNQAKERSESIENHLAQKNINGIIFWLSSAEITMKEKDIIQRIVTEYPSTSDNGIYPTAINRICNESLYKDYEEFLLSLFPANSNNSLMYCFTRQKSKKFSRILLQTLSTTDVAPEKFNEYLSTILTINNPEDIKTLKMMLKK